MAIDGPGLFENDAAHDFVNRVADSGSAEISRAMRIVFDHAEEYLDLDDAADGWAAAELVAAASGEGRRRTADEPSTYDAAIAAIQPDARLLADALRVVDRLASAESELAGLIDDLGEYETWRRSLADLRARLEGARQRLR